MITTKNTSDTADRELLYTRTINAPRNLVFEVFTDPKHVGAWWGPAGFKTTTKEMNVKPGGVWRFIMHGPDGVDYPNFISYLEVVKPERLVFTHGDDINDPNAFMTTITFTEVGKNKTEIATRQVFISKEHRDYLVETYNAIEGHNQHMDRLDQYLSKLV